jgi:putative transposase
LDRQEAGMTVPKELLDELMAGYKKPEDLTGPDGILRQLTKAVMERALEAEMTEHLGYEKHDPAGRGSGNSRNGTGKKTLKTETSEFSIEVPRDRNGEFEPQLVKKRQRHLSGFDEKIISLYARGMTVREIQGHLEELYGVEVSPDLISRVTEVVLDEVKEWQNRPLDAVYPILYLDALVIKVRDQGTVTNKSAYLAIGVNTDGRKEVLGLWLEQSEGAKFWLKIMTELKSRGVCDILVVCCDGLKGFPEAIEAVFPKATVQTCIVHMIRSSMRFVTWKHMKALAAALKTIYRADTAEAAEQALSAFEKTELSRRYPMIAKSWRSNWERVIPFLSFPVEIRRAIYTTNAIESLNFQLRKIIKSRGHFPSDEAAVKLLYLALIRAQRRWARPAHFWKDAYQQMAIQFEGRLPACS